MRAVLLVAATACAARQPVSPQVASTEVDAAVTSHRWLIRECYNTALVLDHSSRGNAKIAVSIDGDGRVVDAHASCSSASPALTTCVAAVLRTIRFPRPVPRDPVQFTVPLVFSTESGATDGCPPVPPSLSDARASEPDDVVMWNRFRLRQCIKTARTRDSEVSGTVQVRVAVGSGGVPVARVACTTAPPEVTSCIVDAFSAMRFASSSVGRSFVTPVVVPSSTGSSSSCSP